MKRTTLELICCPSCKSSLVLNAKDWNGIITDGDVTCSTCDRSYAIQKGIVHFLDPQELEGPNQHYERVYNRLAPFYSLFTKVSFLPFGGERKARQEILNHLGKMDGPTLEVSIGNGVNLPYLYETANMGEIYGIDISIGQLTRCQRLIQKRGWQVELFLAMAESLPFKNEMFDTILHIGGYNYFSDKKRAIDEMIRVVRPGGKVVIADEAERFAKKDHPSSISDQRNADMVPTIDKLVPNSMQDILMEGIWKMHGRHHGFCIAFTKPA